MDTNDMTNEQLVHALTNGGLRIAARIELLRRLNNDGWVSVEDRLPTIEECARGDTFMAYPYDNPIEMTVQFDPYKSNWYRWIPSNGDWEKYGDQTVTHWMPLPTPPKE